MIKINEVAFTSYPVTNMARARKFYEGVLGLEVSRAFPPTDESTWIEYDLGGATLGIDAYPILKPSPDGAMVAFEVEDFDQTVAELKSADIVFTTDLMETPVCHIAIVRDPDNNAVMIHKRKPRNN